MWHEDKPEVSQCHIDSARTESVQYQEATSAVRGGCAAQKEGVLSVLEGLNEEKVCIIKNVTSVVRGDKVCSIRRVAPGV